MLGKTPSFPHEELALDDSDRGREPSVSHSTTLGLPLRGDDKQSRNG